MFLKQEKSEMDDFEEEKFLVLKEKYFEKFNILRKYFKSLLRIPLQKLHKIFWHILLFQNIQSIFLHFEKKTNCKF